MPSLPKAPLFIPGVLSDKGAERQINIKKSDKRIAFLPFLPTGQSTSSTRTFSIVTSCPRDMIAVQVILPNAGAATAITSAAVAVTESLVNASVPTIGGTQYNAVAAAGTNLGFLPMTFAGGAGSAMEAGTNQNPSYTVSDVIPLRAVQPTDSNPYSYIIWRGHFSGVVQPIRTGMSLASTDLVSASLAPFVYKNFVQGTVDGVTNPAAFTATSVNNNLMPIGFIFHTITGGKTIVACGDSITAGGIEGANDQDLADQVVGSWFTRGFLKCKFDKFTGFVNIAMGNSNSTQYRTNLVSFLATGAPADLCFYPVWTPNTPPTTTTGLNTQYMNATIAFDALANVQSKIKLTTPCPYEFASETDRQTVRREIKSMGYDYLDFDDVLYNPAGSGNLRWLALYKLDGTHPNKAGCIELGNYSVASMLEI